MVFELAGKVGQTNIANCGDILAYSFDPSGKRISVVAYVEGAFQYQVHEFGTKSAKIISSACGHISKILYSPFGRFTLLYDSNSGILQFWDTEYGRIREDKIDSISYAEWSPSGAFVAVAGGQGSSRAALSIFLFDGSLINRQQMRNIRFSWRPRGTSFELTPEDYAAIEEQVDPAVERYGKFGVIDENARLEDLEMARREKVDRWMGILTKKSTYTPRVNTMTFTISLGRQDGGDEEDADE